jgi:HlyD family secretion protein
MQRKNIIRAIVIPLVMAAIGYGIWYYIQWTSPPVSATGVSVSGFIEATDIAIAPETGGRITWIGPSEGDRVAAGAPLVRLDDSLLQAQLKSAEASVAVAQAGLTSAQAARDNADKVLQDTLAVQKNPQDLEAKIIAAKGDLDLAELQVQYYNQQKWQWDRQAAILRRDVAQKNLDNLLAIKNNPQDLNSNVTRAQAGLDNAVANLKVVEAQIAQAQAAAGIIRVQISRMTLNAPAAGLVTHRAAEPGELASQGMPLLVISRLEEVTLTVYVPENRVGLVSMGQSVQVFVDSYPGQAFNGSVNWISTQAQFTPKNIQIKEDRMRTVYAVKIRLANPDLKLKAGMPADAAIPLKG